MKIKVPRIGESISEVIVGKWLKKDGETVAVDEILCELESDKANFELRAEHSGILKQIAKEGDTLSIGEVIADIEENGAPSAHPQSSPSQSTTTQKSTSESPIEVPIPTVGESITEVVLSKWLVTNQTEVTLDQPVAELESDKANFELTAPIQGQLQHIAQEGETLSIGAVACHITPSTGAVDAPRTTSTAPVEKTQDSTDPHYANQHPSPAASKILAEKGVSANQLQGSGPSGRITKSDALSAAFSQTIEQSERTPQKETSLTQREVKRERLSSLRRTIARRLVEVKNETAMLTTFNEIDMQPIMGLRSKYKESFKEKYEVSLGFMSFFTKAICVALQDWPSVNAMIDGEEICYHKYCDISIAVSTPKGLVVPVVRNAEQMSFSEIEKEILRLALRAREGKLSIEEMKGGTFTITNGGVFGSLLSTPIINAPQSAILGMHNIVQRPVAIKGEVQIRPMMYVALSYDHRIIDGKESVSFLVRVKQLLEDPSRLLLEI